MQNLSGIISANGNIWWLAGYLHPGNMHGAPFYLDVRQGFQYSRQ